MCTACGTTAIPGPDGSGGGGTAGGSGGSAGSGGGSAGGSAGGSGGGAGGSGGGSPTACAGLDEVQCRATPGCVADTCFLCTCNPSYAGCRAASAPMIGCPPVACAQPNCCRSSTECSGGAACVRGGRPWGCGTCFDTDGDCTDDATCASGQICSPIQCACNATMHCTPGCANDSECGEGEECSGGAHPRCVAKHCQQASDCGIGFDCSSGVCVARPCTSDASCGAAGTAFCVDGYCGRGLGQCVEPVP